MSGANKNSKENEAEKKILREQGAVLYKVVREVFSKR